jgi:asparaginyl-tRNA synthetase
LNFLGSIQIDVSFCLKVSQFYLELRLLLKDVDRVFSIYNSFRKERADFSHLSEFQHIEFEGHVSFDENIRIAEGLLRNIINDVVVESYDSLRMFLAPEEIDDVRESFEPGNIETPHTKRSFSDSPPRL